MASSTPACPLYWDGQLQTTTCVGRFDAYRKTPNHRATDKTVLCSQGQCFENVRPAADATVHGDLDPSLCDSRAFPEGIQGRWNTVQLSSTMVGNDHTINAMFDGKQNIRRVQD